MIPTIDTVHFSYIARGVMQCNLVLTNGYIVSARKEFNPQLSDSTIKQALYNQATEKLNIIQEYHSSVADILRVEDIAKAAHEVNRAYCEAMGDHSQVAWEAAPKWQKASAVQGVQYKLTNLSSTPEDLHDSWMEAKLEDGWVYGKVKDAERKIHPCLVPYSELPKEQQVKDYLFAAVVEALL